MRLSIVLPTLMLAVASVAPVASATWVTTEQDPRREVIERALKEGNLGRAAMTVGEWLGLEPTNPEALQLRGRVEFTQGSRLRSAGRLEQARRYFVQADATYTLAAQHAPELGRSSYHAWGYCLHGLGSYREAIDRLGRALSGGAGDADVWRLTAQCRRLIGDHEEALAAIDRAIALQEKDALFHLERARVLSAQGRAAEAAIELEARSADYVDPLQPAQREVFHWLFRHYLGQKDLDRALAPIDRLCSADPQWVEGRIERGILHYRRGDLERAKKSLVEAVDAKGEAKGYVRGRGYLHLGLIARHGGDTETARTHFERSLQLAPNEAAALLGLAACYRKAGDRVQAKAMAERARRTVALEETLRRLSVRLTNQPRERATHRQRIQVVMDLERWEEAADFLGTFARELPGDPSIVALEKELTARRTKAEGGEKR